MEVELAVPGSAARICWSSAVGDIQQVDLADASRLGLIDEPAVRIPSSSCMVAYS